MASVNENTTIANESLVIETADEAIVLSKTDNAYTEYDTEDHDESLMLTPNEDNLIQKDHCIEIDVQAGLFTTTEDIPSNKQKGKIKQLQLENIDFSVYRSNKCVSFTKTSVSMGKSVRRIYRKYTRNIM